jgi:hypothetical protein
MILENLCEASIEVGICLLLFTAYYILTVFNLLSMADKQAPFLFVENLLWLPIISGP